MRIDWRDIISTLGVVIIVLLAAALMTGFVSELNGRWALATLAVFLLAGLTGLMTGTANLMKHVWSRVVLYMMTSAILVITLFNAFLDSQAWFMVSVLCVGVIWAEFIATHVIFSRRRMKGGPGASTHGLT